MTGVQTCALPIFPSHDKIIGREFHGGNPGKLGIIGAYRAEKKWNTVTVVGMKK